MRLTLRTRKNETPVPAPLAPENVGAPRVGTWYDPRETFGIAGSLAPDMRATWEAEVVWHSGVEAPID